uniref:Cytochrome b-c1 complex subunit 10 n=1 Tax=Nothoprocta perdicaria TaxID=30464 RepID=A0A8C6ZG31_NOTPE
MEEQGRRREAWGCYPGLSLPGTTVPSVLCPPCCPLRTVPSILSPQYCPLCAVHHQTPTLLTWGGVAGTGLVWFTDWKLLLQHVPYIGGKYKAED